MAMSAQCASIFSDNFSNQANYSTPNLANINCDAEGTFASDGSRFVINDIEGENCFACLFGTIFCGDRRAEIDFNPIDISGHENITVTLVFSGENSGSGQFECTGGDFDDNIFIAYNVDGSTGEEMAFCGDDIQSFGSTSYSLSVPDGNSLDLSIFAGADASTETLYLESILVCGTTAVTIIPPPPISVLNDFSGVFTSLCVNEAPFLLPAILPGTPGDVGGVWFDPSGNSVINLDPAIYGAGSFQFTFKSTDDQIGLRTIQIIDNNITISPLTFCQSNSSANLPTSIGGLNGSWVSAGLGINFSSSFTPNQASGTYPAIFSYEDAAGCSINTEIRIIDLPSSIPVPICPPSTVNLMDYFPELKNITDNITFVDDALNFVDTLVDLSTYPAGQVSFTHEIPTEFGCSASELVFDTNCAGALNAIQTFEPANGIICEDECGTLTIDVSGGTEPYFVDFAVVPYLFTIRLPLVPNLNNNSIINNQYQISICNDPTVGLPTYSNNEWRVSPGLITRAEIVATVRDAAGASMVLDLLDITPATNPAFVPTDAAIQACVADENAFSDLATIAGFNDYSWYDGDPAAGGTLITDYTSVDLTTLWAIYSDANGCESDATKAGYTVQTCTIDCSAVTTPVLSSAEANILTCASGNYEFRVQNNPYQVLWFDATNDNQLGPPSFVFVPANHGNYYAVTVDGTCVSDRLNISLTFHVAPVYTIEDCTTDGSTSTLDISYNGDIDAATTDGTLTNIGAGTWRISDLPNGNDFTVGFEQSTGCVSEQTIRYNDLTCTAIACPETGLDTTVFISFTGAGTSVDLTQLVRDNNGLYTFLNEGGFPIADPQNYFFSTTQIRLTHDFAGNAGCQASEAVIVLIKQAITTPIIKGICRDSVFCTPVEIHLPRGGGPPYRFDFEIFNSSVRLPVEYQQADLLEDTILVVNICVQGTENLFVQSSKTFFLSRTASDGTINITNLQDATGVFSGSVPPIQVEFSELPNPNDDVDLQEICLSQAVGYNIDQLNPLVLSDQTNSIEWWEKRPSNPLTEDIELVENGMVSINNRDSLYALVINADGCKKEVRVDFEVFPDDRAEIDYKPFYCVSEAIRPNIAAFTDPGVFTIVAPTGDGAIINPTDGTLTNAVANTIYSINYVTGDALCPADEDFTIEILESTDIRCSCTLPLPTILNITTIDNGVKFCQRSAKPPFIVENNTGYDVFWYASESDLTPINAVASDTLLVEDDDIFFYARYEDGTGCVSDFSSVKLIQGFSIQLPQSPISICEGTDMINLNAYVRNLASGRADSAILVSGIWTDDQGDEITTSGGFDVTGLAFNQEYVFDYTFSEEGGSCESSNPVRIIRTSFADIDVATFRCDAAMSMYQRDILINPDFNISLLSNAGDFSGGDGNFVVTNVPVGMSIQIELTDRYGNCNASPSFPSPSCDCPIIPTPTLLNDLPICFEEEFRVDNVGDVYNVAWYANETGGSPIEAGNTFNPISGGTYYVEFIDPSSSCSSLRASVSKSDNFGTNRQDINTTDLTVCAEDGISFIAVNTDPGFEMGWFAGGDRENPVAVGNTFRPPSNGTYFAGLILDGKCISSTIEQLVFRENPLPNIELLDTTCSRDLQSYSLRFRAFGDLEFEQNTGDDPIRQNSEYTINNINAGAQLALIITDLNTTCPNTQLLDAIECQCPVIADPILQTDTLTVCDNTSDYSLSVSNIVGNDLSANWYDAEQGGNLLSSQSFSFSPPVPGDYFVEMVDTISFCVSNRIPVTLEFVESPEAGIGFIDTICGIGQLDLNSLLSVNVDSTGLWVDDSSQQLDRVVDLTMLPAATQVELIYIVTNENNCIDSSSNALYIQESINAGNLDIEPLQLCAETDSIVDFDALLGVHDDGFWINDAQTNIDLNSGSAVNINEFISGQFTYSYFIEGDEVCPSAQNDILVNINGLPQVGLDSRDTVCVEGELDYNFTTALGGISDLTGSWQDVASVLNVDINDNPGIVDISNLTSGDYTFVYEDSSNGFCAASSTLDIHILPDNSGGVDTIMHRCESDLISLNFEEVLPSATAYSLSYDGSDPLDFSDVTRVDVQSLIPGTYNFTNVADNMMCTASTSSVRLVVETPVEIPDIDLNIDLCADRTVDLLDYVSSDKSGFFTDLFPTGNLNGTTLSTQGLEIDFGYSFTYEVPADSVCAAGSTAFIVNITGEPNAGQSPAEIPICLGESINMMNLIESTADQNGVFVDIESSGGVADSVFNTDNLSESKYFVYYIVGGGICPADTATIIFDVRAIPDAGADIDIPLCSSDVMSVDLVSALGGINDGGTWVDAQGQLDVSIPESVDASGLPTLSPYFVEYVLSNSICTDTVALTFMIDELPDAGTPNLELFECLESNQPLNLLGVFPTADLGTWSMGNVPIADPVAFDLDGLLPGSNILTHTVESSTGLNICPIAAVDVNIVMESAANAGVDREKILCQGMGYDLFDLIDDATDANGNFEDINNYGNLVNSQILANTFTTGQLEYIYVVASNTSCLPDTAIISITMEAAPDAGESNGNTLCTEDIIDLESYLIDADAGGIFENSETGIVYNDPLVNTTGISGLQEIWYIVESQNCNADTALFTFNINPKYTNRDTFFLMVGDSIFVDGAYRFTSENIQENLQSNFSCDSTIITNLIFSDVSISFGDVTCFGESNGRINIAINEGAAPFRYEWLETEQGILNGSGNINVTGFDIDIEDLPEGNYTVSVFDSNNMIIGRTESNIGLENQLNPLVTIDPLLCPNGNEGAISVDLPGAIDQFSFRWSTGDTTNNIDSLVSGLYNLDITDNLTSCTYPLEYFIFEPEPFQVDTFITDFQCGEGAMGAIELEVLSAGNSFYTFSLDGEEPQSVGLFTDLLPGAYDITVFDENGCSFDYTNLEVLQATDNIIEITPNEINLFEEDVEEINVLINFQEVSVEWVDSIGLDCTDCLNPKLTGIESGTYVINVTDAFGCTVTDSIVVNVSKYLKPVPDIYIPNTFSTSEDQENSRFLPLLNGEYPGTFELHVFDRWGNKMYQETNTIDERGNGWNGRHNGNLVVPGVYVYHVIFRLENGTLLRRSGDVTVLR